MIGKSNTGGGKSSSNIGKYVWSRREYTPEKTISNLSFTATLPKISDEREYWNITNANYDTSRISNFLDFYEGFYRSDVSYYKFQKISGTLYYSEGSNREVVSATAEKIIFYNYTVNAIERVYTFKHDGPKTLNAIIGAIKDYVVSDDSSAYPNGAVHTDGYYYELLASV